MEDARRAKQVMHWIPGEKGNQDHSHRTTDHQQASSRVLPCLIFYPDGDIWGDLEHMI